MAERGMVREERRLIEGEWWEVVSDWLAALLLSVVSKLADAEQPSLACPREDGHRPPFVMRCELTFTLSCYAVVNEVVLVSQQRSVATLVSVTTSMSKWGV
jgi:hypothetical protein